MILIISGIVALVGLGLIVSGWIFNNTDLLSAGCISLVISVLVGFVLLGTICTVKKVKTIMPSTIEITKDTAILSYGLKDTEVIVTHDIRVIWNPEKYVVQKSVDYNSYGFPIGNCEEYSIVLKETEK